MKREDRKKVKELLSSEKLKELDAKSMARAVRLYDVIKDMKLGDKLQRIFRTYIVFGRNVNYAIVDPVTLEVINYPDDAYMAYEIHKYLTDNGIDCDIIAYRRYAKPFHE